MKHTTITVRVTKEELRLVKKYLKACKIKFLSVFIREMLLNKVTAPIGAVVHYSKKRGE